MDTFDVAYAKEHLEDLHERAARGEEVRISDPRLGTLIVRPTADTPPMLYPERKLGLMRHLPVIPDARLFEPLSDDEMGWLSGEHSDGA